MGIEMAAIVFVGFWGEDVREDIRLGSWRDSWSWRSTGQRHWANAIQSKRAIEQKDLRPRLVARLVPMA